MQQDGNLKIKHVKKIKCIVVIRLPKSIQILFPIPVYCQHFPDSVFLPKNVKLKTKYVTGDGGGLNVAGLSRPQTSLDLHCLDEVILRQIDHKPPFSIVDIPG